MAGNTRRRLQSNVLHDENGNPVTVVLSGGTYRLAVDLAGSEIQIGAVELDDAESSTRAAIRQDAAAFPALATDFGGLLIAGRDDGGAGQTRHVRVDASGRILTSPTTAPGTQIQSVTVPVPGGVVPAGAPPANTLAITVQNVSVGVVGSVIAVREVGGVAGAGEFLPLYGTFTFEKAVQALELELIAGGPATANLIYEIV
jgi:hypothetical protein